MIDWRSVPFCPAPPSFALMDCLFDDKEREREKNVCALRFTGFYRVCIKADSCHWWISNGPTKTRSCRLRFTGFYRVFFFGFSGSNLSLRVKEAAESNETKPSKQLGKERKEKKREGPPPPPPPPPRWLRLRRRHWSNRSCHPPFHHPLHPPPRRPTHPPFCRRRILRSLVFAPWNRNDFDWTLISSRLLLLCFFFSCLFFIYYRMLIRPSFLLDPTHSSFGFLSFPIGSSSLLFFLHSRLVFVSSDSDRILIRPNFARHRGSICFWLLLRKPCRTTLAFEKQSWTRESHLRRLRQSFYSSIKVNKWSKTRWGLFFLFVFLTARNLSETCTSVLCFYFLVLNKKTILNRPYIHFNRVKNSVKLGILFRAITKLLLRANSKV